MLMSNETTPTVFPIIQHNFASEGFICIILLMHVVVKVSSVNLTTDHVI